MRALTGEGLILDDKFRAAPEQRGLTLLFTLQAGA